MTRRKWWIFVVHLRTPRPALKPATPFVRLLPRRFHRTRLHVAWRNEQLASAPTTTAIRTRVRWTRV